MFFKNASETRICRVESFGSSVGLIISCIIPLCMLCSYRTQGVRVCACIVFNWDEWRMPRSVFDIGEKAGFLTVIAELPKGTRYQRRYLVRCDCGTEKAVMGYDLRPGKTVSCGCHRRAAAVISGHRNRRHGDHRTAEYRCWAGMKKRCNNPNDSSFTNYGGRGVTVCDRWMSYENFLADMGRKPSATHSIDRREVNGNYEPGNCRWATPLEQALNKRPMPAAQIARFTAAGNVANRGKKRSPEQIARIRAGQMAYRERRSSLASPRGEVSGPPRR